MAFDYQRLTEITTLPSAAGVVYTKSSGTKAYVRLIVLHNSNTISEAVKLYVVPDSAGSVGTPGVTNEIYSESLAAGDTRIIEFATPGLLLLDNNETIQGVTTTASKVTITITGGLE